MVMETGKTVTSHLVVVTQTLGSLWVLGYAGTSQTLEHLKSFWGVQGLPECHGWVVGDGEGHYTSVGGCSGIYVRWESLQVLV